MVRGRFIHACVALAALLAACAGENAGDADGRLRVVATVSPITNIIQNVGGDLISLTGLVPEGVNSHTFEPRPSDARLLAEADVVFMNGLNLEVPTEELAVANVRDGVEIVKLADRILPREEWIFDFSFPEADGDPNPHVWTSPVHAKRIAAAVHEVLAGLLPAETDALDANLAAFSQRLDALDAAARAATETVPAENRKLLTYHDSFPYFAREYGWTVVGAIQPSDFSEPTPREVARLIDQIKAERIPAIFGSEVFASPVLEQIARATGARYVDELRDDDLPGKAGDQDHSYVGLMVFDFRTFMGALGGDVSGFDAIDTSNLAGEGSVEYRE